MIFQIIVKHNLIKVLYLKDLFDTVIKFGFCDVFINSNYNEKTKNYNKYLNEKVFSCNQLNHYQQTFYHLLLLNNYNI